MQLLHEAELLIAQSNGGWVASKIDRRGSHSKL